MKQTLQLKLSQHLTLTPQLQQSIRLLQLSTLELNQELERFIAENPLLEREDLPPDVPFTPGRLNGDGATATADVRSDEPVPVDAAAGEAVAATQDWFADAPSFSGGRDDGEESD